MTPQLIEHIQSFLGKGIIDFAKISGGDISKAYKLTSEDQKWFVKLNSNKFEEVFRIESDALQYLNSKSSLLIPKVVALDSHQDVSYLILEYIDPVLPSKEFWIKLGSGLAELHRNVSANYGWHSENFIGSIRQSNVRSDSWSEFYSTNRLKPLFDKGLKSGIFNKNDERLYLSFIRKLADMVPNERPALCHGDLWNGNFLSGLNGPYLIDPSTSYMHREMDIAMSKLFGGFEYSFYESYNNSFPLEPGFEERMDIYQLYYILVHAILFGGNYILSTKQILKKYGA